MLLHNLRQVMITVFPNSCGVSVNFEIHVLLLEIATLSAVSDSSAAAGLWGPCRHLAERPSPDTRDVSSPAVRCSTRFICKNPCWFSQQPDRVATVLLTSSFGHGNRGRRRQAADGRDRWLHGPCLQGCCHLIRHTCPMPKASSHLEGCCLG